MKHESVSVFLYRTHGSINRYIWLKLTLIFDSVIQNQWSSSSHHEQFNIVIATIICLLCFIPICCHTQQYFSYIVTGSANKTCFQAAWEYLKLT